MSRLQLTILLEFAQSWCSESLSGAVLGHKFHSMQLNSFALFALPLPYFYVLLLVV